MRVPLVGPAYRAASRLQSAQRCVNLYIEVAEKPSKTPAMLRCTPGTEVVATLGNGPIRGMIGAGRFLYAVSGRGVYRVGTAFTAVQIGEIGSLTGIVSMASNGQQILIVDGLAGWIIDLAAGTLTKITDTDFPAGVTSATFIDGYFVVCGDGSGHIYWSQLLDGSDWDGLDFASAEGGPDAAVTVIADHRELWVFGENTTEVFLNTGDAAQPFQRAGNAFIEHGCAAAASVAKMDNTVFWLGTDDRGEGTIWRAAGYQPQRISTHAIEWAIAQYPTIDDAVAYTYQAQGHDFYVISFPSGNATWCYDATSGEWHERAWYNPATGDLERHRGHAQAFFARRQVIADWEDGRLYVMREGLATDAGGPIKRLRSTQVAADAENLNWVFYGRFQVDVETGIGLQAGQGSDPKMMLRTSDDGGIRWSNVRLATLGRAGNTAARCKWERCGRGRARVWEVSWTDPVITALLGAVTFAEAGIA